MTIEEQIAEKQREINTIDFIAGRCTTDGQARCYEENRRQKVAELVALEKKLRQGGSSDES